MNDNNKKQRRVSFADEAPEYNIYEKEASTLSTTTEDVTADLTCDQTKIGNTFFDITRKYEDKIKRESLNLHTSNTEDNTTNEENVIMEENKIFEENVIMEDADYNNKINDLNADPQLDNEIIEEEINHKLDNENKNTKEENKENDTLMSNSTIVFDELINTQHIRTLVPPKKQTKVNLNDVLIEQGIRFLDDIVVSSTRRETLSKSKKEVDPSLILYYKYYLSERIKFLDDFSEVLKSDLFKLSEDIKKIEDNFDIQGTLLEKEDKSRLRSLKSDCRNRATVSWYEMRAKKELEFNEIMIKAKNEILTIYNTKENELKKISNIKEELIKEFEELSTKICSLKGYNTQNITSGNLVKLRGDIKSHEQVLDDYQREYENLKNDLINKKIKDDSLEKKYKDLKKEISELESQFRNASVSENDLDEVKSEYRKMSAILGIEIHEYKKGKIAFSFLNYEINIENNEVTGKYTGIDNTIHKYGLLIIREIRNNFIIEIIRALNIIQEIYKEVTLIEENNGVECYIKDDKLNIIISVNDIKQFRRYKVHVEINKSLDILIEREGDKYLYNAKKDKGVILDHLE